MKNYIYSKNGANVSILKIESHHCYLCGNLFDFNKHKKTRHHAIPEEFNPERNVIVMVGKSCHESIHNGKSLFPVEKIKLKKIIKGMKNQHEAVGEKIDNAMKELDRKNIVEERKND